FYFFFQAEDGIRYRNVTGVQTCALPISPLNSINYSIIRFAQVLLWAAECEIKADNGDPAKAEEYVNRVRSRAANPDGFVRDDNRSEERRVGRECRARCEVNHEKKR